MLTLSLSLFCCAQEDEGYVCGIARISLLDLARGATRQAFHAPLLPHTTIRGAASLDWTTRPGNYAEVCQGWDHITI